MKGVKTTSDYIPWSDAINVIHKLYRDKNYDTDNISSRFERHDNYKS